MEANIFGLFEQRQLEIALRDSQKAQHIKDFSRFLAAYFANLPLICSRNENRSLPSLFQLDDQKLDNAYFYEINRRQVSINLPTSYTPTLAVQLLFKSNLLLEAIFYVEQFNDIRSSLIMRHLVDLKCGLKLFDDYCQEQFIHKFFNQLPSLIEDGVADQIQAYLTKFIDFLVQLSTIFNYDFLKQFSRHLIDRIELLSTGFDEEIPEIVALPRPPIYALPSESVFEHDLNKELSVWNELHFSIKIYFLLLQRTNRLNFIIQQTTSWLCRLNVDFETELPTLFQLETNEIDNEISEQFQRVLLVVLRISARDSLCSSIRCNDSETLIDELTQKYIELFPTNSHDTKNTLQRWAESANHVDFSQIMLFFQFVQENSYQAECYLPPLSKATLEKWKSIIFMHTHKQHIMPEHQIQVLADEDKMKISKFDYQKLQFIAYSLPSLSLNDPSLVQISLQLHPSNFCSSIHEDIVEQDTNTIETTGTLTKHKMNPIDQIDEQQNLKQQIRSTIRRLSRQALTTRAESFRHLPHLVDDFNRHLSATERQSDLQFLSTIRNLTSTPKTTIRRSLSEKNLVTTKSNVWKPREGVKIEARENLGDELKAISARLAKLREKWTPNANKFDENKTEDIKVEETLQSLSSGISSSNSQLDLPENFANKHKRYRKKRPKIPSEQHENVQENTNTQRLSDNNQLAELEYGELKYEEQSLVEEINNTYELEQVDSKIEDNIEEKVEETYPIELKNIENQPNEEQFQIPITPGSIERLDFSLLSNRDDKPKRPKDGWSEVSILEKTPSTTKTIQKATKTLKAYPDWLTLLPLDDSSKSSRLLDLNHYKNKKVTQREPLPLKPNRPSKVYDSGFLESERVTRNEQTVDQLAALSFDMSPNEVRRLIVECNNE